MKITITAKPLVMSFYEPNVIFESLTSSLIALELKTGRRGYMGGAQCPHQPVKSPYTFPRRPIRAKTEGG